MLKGKAKTDYMREYMRKYRARSNVRPTVRPSFDTPNYDHSEYVEGQGRVDFDADGNIIPDL